MKIVIVGGNAGGASAAARLRRLNENAEIIIFEKKNFISFANCGLPYFIGGEIADQKSLSVQTPESFRSRFNVAVNINSEVVEVNVAQKQVVYKKGEDSLVENFDKLVLSPGSKPIFPPIPGIRCPCIFTLHTIPDSVQIKEYVQKNVCKKAVVIGGGLIGMETSENFAKLGLDVTIVDKAPQILAGLDEDVVLEVQSYLRTKNVKFILSNGIKKFTEKKKENGISVQVELENGGVVLDADIVLFDIGDRPNTAFLSSSGLSLSPADGGIVVNEHMQTSHPDIYAVGDAVHITHFLTHEVIRFPLAGPASKQGRIAADHISGISRSYKGAQGSCIFRLFDLVVGQTGLTEKNLKKLAASSASSSSSSPSSSSSSSSSSSPPSAFPAAANYERVYIYPPSHASYFPGAKNMSIKVLFEKGTGVLLGAQIVGFDGVDKRTDVLAVAIRQRLTCHEVAELELCYAPPFSSAKDPVNVVGSVIQNIVEGRVAQYFWDEVDRLPRDGSVILLDVRTPGEFARGSFAGAINIPLDSLRARLGELGDKKKRIYCNCQVGLRGYLACRILSQNGFDCVNLSGGYRLYDVFTKEKNQL